MKIICFTLLAMAGLMAQEEPQPVLMVIANQDFYYPDYLEPRTGLESQGLSVVVAAANTGLATPHGGSPQVQPDIALADVQAADYSALLIVGGYGSAAYQYAFEGSYANGAYQGDPSTKSIVNQLIVDFLSQEKHTTAICFGVSVLAWARVDGASPLAGRSVTAYAGPSPSFTVNGTYHGSTPTAWHMNQNNATVFASGAVGDPGTSSDDVVVDGLIITAEDWRAGFTLGDTLGSLIWDAFVVEPEPVDPVLMVIANQHFYYQEYGHTRTALEAAGLSVVVTAENEVLSFPHPGTGEPSGFSGLMPDIALANVDAADYSTIVFVGGWGSSQYQYAFPGTYYSGTYAGNAATKTVVNNLINDFVDQGKPIAAICFGVTALAWARVDGQSPLQNKDVCTYQSGSPGFQMNGVGYPGNSVPASWHMEENGASVLPAFSIGLGNTAVDDVWVDQSNGLLVITAQNWDSATYFGQTIAQTLLNP